MKKIDMLKGFAARGEWIKALSLAASFSRLGNARDAIKAADMAAKHRDFCIQIHKDPDALIAAGLAALRARYAL